MSLSIDLLKQAHHLASLEDRRPKQASLRRAISAAYYALFHLLSASAVQRISPANPSGLSPRIARTLAHGEMRDVCENISRKSPGPILKELVPGGFSPELQSVAIAFAELQDARHRADYDVAAVHNRLDTLKLLQQAQGAFDNWRAVADSDEATVFLSAFLFARSGIRADECRFNV